MNKIVAIIVIGFALAVGAGQVRSPKDIARLGKDKTMIATSSLMPSGIPKPLAIPASIVRTNSQPIRTNMGFFFSATNVFGKSNYLVLWDTDFNGKFTNVLGWIKAGDTNTYHSPIWTNLKTVYFKLVIF